MPCHTTRILHVLCVCALAACAVQEQNPQAPELRPELRPALSPEPEKVEEAGPSDASKRDAAYYRSIQASFVSAGRLRRDRNPNDAWFGPDELVNNFTNIALYDEYSEQDGTFVRGKTPSYLRRWNRPIRIGLNFGESVPQKQRAKDRKQVHFFANRLSRLSGLDIKISDNTAGNFAVLFLNRDEQRDLGKLFGDKVPQLLPEIIREIEASPRQIYCVAYTFSDGPGQGYSGAVILIKAEQPDLLRLSCIQEEMAQALGLSNDSPSARPSIFNDDEEFALLTSHDEMLIRMLYDRRLRLGMTADTAAPILPEVALEVYAGVSG